MAGARSVRERSCSLSSLICRTGLATKGRCGFAERVRAGGNGRIGDLFGLSSIDPCLSLDLVEYLFLTAWRRLYIGARLGGICRVLAFQPFARVAAPLSFQRAQSVHALLRVEHESHDIAGDGIGRARSSAMLDHHSPGIARVVKGSEEDEQSVVAILPRAASTV